MADTLILNADYSPTTIVPLSTLNWQEAIKMVYLDRVRVLEYYDAWEVHSPTTTMRVPSVMVLNEHIKASHTVRYSKSLIHLRDTYKCQYCAEDFHDYAWELTLDHVIPRKLGGKTRWDNIVSACSPCNMKKSHHLNMKPLVAPKRPSFWELIDARRKLPIKIPIGSKWNQYLIWDESLIEWVKHGK